MSFQLAPIAVAELRANASHADDTVTAKLEGTADLPARAALEALLEQLHAESVRLAVKQVVFDFTQLEFMNSSCFKSFVSWISRIETMDPDTQYRVVFIANPSMHWQRRSLRAIAAFAPDLINVY